MDKLPENIEELFDEAIEAHKARGFAGAAFKSCERKRPCKPITATVSEWNEYVRAHEEHETTLAVLESELESRQDVWRHVEKGLLVLLPLFTYFSHRGYTISNRPHYYRDSKRYFIDIQKKDNECTNTS